MDLLNRLPDIDRSDLASRLPSYVRRNPRVSLVVGCLWLANMLVCLVLGGGLMVSTIRGRIEARRAALPAAPVTAGAATPSLAPVADLPTSLPTPDCAPARLILGEATYRIESVARPADGSLPTPAQDLQVIYWLEGTDSNLVFVLGSADLPSQVSGGDLATITWADCTAQSYHLSAAQLASLDDPALLDQAQAAITILALGAQPDELMAVRGGVEEAEFQEYELFQPRAEELLASVSMEQVLAPPDGQSIQVDVTISNYGVSEFTLMASDVGLFTESEAQLGLIGSEPALPQVLQPGQSLDFSFTFARPASGLGVLRVFNVEYMLDDFK